MRKELGKLRFNGEALTVVNAARQLGAFLNCSFRHYVGTTADRLSRATFSAERVACLPNAAHIKRSMLAATSLQQGLYDYAVTAIARKKVEAWGASCLRAWWGNGRRQRAKELCWGLFAKGHVDHL